MAGKFAHILGFLGLNGNTDPVTEAHLQAADDKIAQLEQDKSAAELRASSVEGALATAQAALDTEKANVTKVTGELTTANGKVATLEGWKKEQTAKDGRTEDESNKLDQGDQAPKAAFETAADAAIAKMRKRVGPDQA